MKTLNLRSQFAVMQAMPHYLPSANTLTDEQAQQIAERFGDYLPDLQRELEQARSAGLSVMLRADSRGDGLGLFLNAERLFFSYVYELHYEAACDSEATARREQYDE